MAEVLLLNPSPRRHKRRKNPTAAQRRARAAFGRMAKARARAANPAHKRRRRRNPVAPVATVLANPRHRRRARRRNPALRVYRAARRRNPIGMGSLSLTGILGPIKEAAIMGAGAVAFEYGYGYIDRMLPPSMQVKPTGVGVGDAVKAVLTVVAGKLLNRPTRGLAMTAAKGSLTVQMAGLVNELLPASMKSSAVGYYSPAGMITNANTRVGPNRTRLNAYIAPGNTPLLNAYMRPGASPLLSGSARQREGYPR